MINPTIVYLNAKDMNVFFGSDRMKMFGQDDDDTTVIIRINPVDAAKLIRSLNEFMEATDAKG